MRSDIPAAAGKVARRATAGVALAAPVITLLTDFGRQDAYVGVMKGVVLTISPMARLVDLSHEVPPQDVSCGAFLLLTSYAYFPPGTVHLAVVDPGVGSTRRLLAVAAGGQFFVGPDNGVLRWALEMMDGPLAAVSLENPRLRLAEVSRTFHGRDVLAPAAAHLSLGVPLAAFGPAVDATTLAGRPFPQPRAVATGLEGEVLHVDRFGNLITNVRAAALGEAPARITVLVAGRRIEGLSESYQEGGDLLALAGSSGFLEIAVPNGSAARSLGLRRGAPVEVQWTVAG